MSKLNSFKAGPIVLDVIGKTLSKEDIRRIAHPKTGGVILFGRNYQDRAQLTALTKAIKAIRSDVMISIDHEGGRVQRCRTDGFTHLPAMKKLGVKVIKKIDKNFNQIFTEWIQTDNTINYKLTHSTEDIVNMLMQHIPYNQVA